MPIDPNIPLSFKFPEIAVPDKAERMRLADLAQLREHRQIEIDEARKKIARGEALRKAMVVDEQGRVDLPKSLAAINRIDPTVGLELQTQLQAQQKAQQQAQVKDLSQRAFALRNTPAEKRAGVYPEMRRQALATGLYRPEDLPEEVPSEEMLQALSFGALTPQEQQKVLNLIAEERRAAAKEGREVSESKGKIEGQQLTNLQTEMGIAERTLPQNAEGWAAWRASLSEPLRRRIPETYSPEAVAQVQRMALPAKERKELETPKPPTSAAQLAFMASDPRVPEPQRQAAASALKLVKQYQGQGDNKTTMQERLAQLYNIPEAQRTPQQKQEMESVEKALTVVATAYGAGYKPLNTPGGGLVYYHPGTGQQVTPPQGTRGPYGAAERQQIAGLDEMAGQLKELRGLARKHRDVIGPAMGRITDVQRRLVGAGDEVNRLFRISDNLADQLLRARSGAQINEKEYDRLRTLVPNPRQAEEKFFSDLDSFEKELQGLLSRRSGAAPLVQNLQKGKGAALPDPAGLR
ncbi:MAG: hypothetical protein ABFD89_29560 [Bryobacteraceae bacterium]